MPETDVFLCYRQAGAQTAKLFKRYLMKTNFQGKVWYSNEEYLGNYKNDIDDLIQHAEAIVVFIDNDFTKGFLQSGKSIECITELEFINIVKKQLSDIPAQLFTVYLDRQGFTENEIAVLETTLKEYRVGNAVEALKLITQNNQILFSTRSDYEEILFDRIQTALSKKLNYAIDHVVGNFYFGTMPTTVDVVLWDVERGIDINSVHFELDSKRIPFYCKVQNARSNILFEGQNNQMISMLGFDAVLSDDFEEKTVYIKYQTIEYELFYKCLKLWNQLDCEKMISLYDWKKDLYSVPNAMGMSFMVITSDEKLLFTRRSELRSVRSNEYDCSIVEGLKPISLDQFGNEYSINEENYLEREILRAFREEVCSVDSIKVKVCGLVLDKKYGQWNLIGTIRTDYTADDIKRLHSTRADTYEATYIEFAEYTIDGELSIVPLKKYIEKYIISEMWGMAFATVYAALLDVGFTPKDIDELTMNMGY